jgi:1,4-dihydroxy-2-naphthoate octaprenyltransferase
MNQFSKFICIQLGVFIKWIYSGGSKSYSEMESEENTIKIGEIAFFIIVGILILIYYSQDSNSTIVI